MHYGALIKQKEICHSTLFACKSVLMRGSSWYCLPGAGDLDGDLGPDCFVCFASVNFAKCNFSELIV